jgi:hypothetical protein
MNASSKAAFAVAIFGGLLAVAAIILKYEILAIVDAILVAVVLTGMAVSRRSTNNAYNGMEMYFTDEAGDMQRCTIFAYNEETRKAMFERAKAVDKEEA